MGEEKFGKNIGVEKKKGDERKWFKMIGKGILRGKKKKKEIERMIVKRIKIERSLKERKD